ncbi:hypothetical protein [Sediminibacterium sp.]|uniref:hypothetical protein n=1 Tax=Sediminibacterium sp. TaxID=1917865 RepID=UPI003F71807E
MEKETVYKYADEWIAHCVTNKGNSSSHFIDDSIEDSDIIEVAVIKLLEEYELITFLSANRKSSVIVLTVNGYKASKIKGGIKEYIKSKKLEISTITAIDKISNGFWESIGNKLGEHLIKIILIVIIMVIALLYRACN